MGWIGGGIMGILLVALFVSIFYVGQDESEDIEL